MRLMSYLLIQNVSAKKIFHPERFNAEKGGRERGREGSWGRKSLFPRTFPEFLPSPSLPPSNFQLQVGRTQVLTLPGPNHLRSPGSQLSIPLSTSRVDKAEHSTYKKSRESPQNLCNKMRHADARGPSPAPSGRRVPC